MKTHTLKNGIILEDYRDIHGLIRVKNQKSRYITMMYNSVTRSFYISTIATWIFKDELPAYQAEINEMVEACREANELIN